MKPLFSLMLVLGVLAGCLSAAKWEFSTVQKLERPLSQEQSVGIPMPADGRFDETLYPGSGAKTAAAFRNAFASRSVMAESYSCPEDACLHMAAEKGHRYVVHLELVHWEERQTSASGRPDRVTVKASVFNVDTGKRLTSAYLQGIGTRRTMGGEHVEDLLPKLADDFIQSLYRK